MSRRKRYSIQGREYATQTALDADIKRALNSHPVNTEFTDPLLAAVVNELHPDVRAAGQRVTRFQYLTHTEQFRRRMDSATRYRGGNVVLGWFEPLGAWTDVTVYPHRKPDTTGQFKRALREKIAFYLPNPKPIDICANPGCMAGGYELEYEHLDPTFDEIAGQCLALFTPDELASRFGHNKWIPGREHLSHCIPDDHPGVQLLYKLHENNEWIWLCAFHHRHVDPKKLAL